MFFKYYGNYSLQPTQSDCHFLTGTKWDKSHRHVPTQCTTKRKTPPDKYPSYNTDLLQKDSHRGVIALLLSFQQLLETPPYTRLREHTSPRTQYDQRWRNENTATGAGEMDQRIRAPEVLGLIPSTTWQLPTLYKSNPRTQMPSSAIQICK